MSSSYHGKRWKPIQAGKGRSKVRNPKGWEGYVLVLSLGLVIGFIAGITWNLTMSTPRIVYVEKPVPMTPEEAAENKGESKDRQRVSAALQRFYESGRSDEELAVLYRQFKDRGWDVPEEIEKAYEKKITNAHRPIE